jgi:hypothetical protein
VTLSHAAVDQVNRLPRRKERNGMILDYLKTSGLRSG